MSLSPRFLGLAALLVGCTLSLGCPSSLYRGETRLNDDGSVERVVYQPGAETPQEASKPASWVKATFAPDPEALKKQNFGGNYAELPAGEFGKERPYFVGVGRFPSPKAIPNYYEKKALPQSGQDDAKLVRNYERIDHVLVVEHRWEETLTDSVTREGMTKARDELADLLISVFAHTFEQAYGKEYDASGLVKWLQGEGKAWWAEMTDYAYLHCLNHKTADAEEALGQALRAIASRHGLNLPRTSEGDPSEPDKRAMIDFALGLLRQHVKSKSDGQPVAAKTAMKWIEDVTKGRDDQGQPNDWQKALDEVVAAKYDGKDALTLKTTLLLARIFGLHYPESFFHARTFEYLMTFPGDVTETNGELQGKNKVVWKFPAKLAYPRGYAMKARSLSVQKELQKELLGAEPLNELKNREQFVFLMKWAPEPLKAAIRECRVQRSLTPLEAYQKKANPDEQEWIKGLMDVLKPPPAEQPE